MKIRRLVVASAALFLGIVSCAQEDTPPTGELILALQTDMQLPKDVDKVRIRISSFGNTLFSNDYQVGPNDLKIPATLGLLANPDHPSSPVTIQVIAFQQGKPRVLRETITTIPQERIATLRVPIEWLCDASAKLDNGEPVSTCPTGLTCVSGACVDSTVDSVKLPDFSAAEIFGGGDGSGNGACFEVGQCFAKTVQAPVDLANCRLTLPSMSPNLNVALKLPGTGDGICNAGVCLIPLDGGEGGQWSVAGGAGTIQLPAAACDRLAKGKVESVLVSTACPTKTIQMPTCGPWSSTGGDDRVTPDGGDTSAADGGTSPLDGGGSSSDAGTVDGKSSQMESGTRDGGGSDDGFKFVDTGAPDGGVLVADSGGADAGMSTDVGTGAADASASPFDAADDAKTATCAPPPPPTDGGFCTGVFSMPAPLDTCRWSAPGSIATMGAGFCPNLLNVQLNDWPESGSPPVMLPQVPNGACGEGFGWQYSLSGGEVELCPTTCSMSMGAGVKVTFMYGCPSMMMGPPPDGGAPPIDASMQANGRAIPGGTFMMGCTPGDSSCGGDEDPYHQVTVSDFTIDETEVTQGAYDLCIRSGTCIAPPCGWAPSTNANWPVTCVSWDEAANYCNWVGKRLPSEAEWEIAARGTNEIVYPWGNAAPDCTRANFLACALGASQPVRSFAAGVSSSGAYDMAGNVSEWVIDWYAPMYPAQPPPNPMGPGNGAMRIVRGGDYQSDPVDIRVSKRRQMEPVTRIDSIGFRCARPGL